MTGALEAAWAAQLQTVRWFGGKGAGAVITRLDPLPWYTAAGAIPAVRSEVATLQYPDGHTEYYHLLVAHYPASSPVAGTVVGESGVDGQTLRVVDATTDQPALEAFVRQTQPAFAGVAVRLWTGEQSNTTLCLGDDDLYKLFRRIEPGPNLDAEVLVALAGASVPRVHGRLEGPWPAGSTTDLGMVIERIPGVRDGWELACAACAAGEDFGERAEALGRALREVHGRLAAAFGTAVRSGDELADVMSTRMDAAVAQAPTLAPHAEALRAAFGTLRGQELEVQRIHGDFHLGQTLAGPRGWTIIDFEGEPAKSAAERREFDSPWRDVAGMLRSFDYARSAHADPGGAEATTWADRARTGFLSGYCGTTQARDDLLSAYVIDKAVYEVLYELRNRPDWVGIPLRAIRAATGQADPPREDEREDKE